MGHLPVSLFVKSRPTELIVTEDEFRDGSAHYETCY